MITNLKDSLTHVVKKNKPSLKDMLIKMVYNGFDSIKITEHINKSYKTDLSVETIETIIKDSKAINVSQPIFSYLSEIDKIVKRLKKNLRVSKYDINMIKMYSDIIASNILNETNKS